ncbi:MAG TPA: hypothetical protein VGR79_00285 [Stellaceae bacterium]|nr:hypothetical protein [Stellaceae bacterium]
MSDPAALWSEVGKSQLEALRHDPAVAKLLPAFEAKVAAARLTPAAATSRVLAALRGTPS